jgi:hypothetical protein
MPNQTKLVDFTKVNSDSLSDLASLVSLILESLRYPNDPNTPHANDLIPRLQAMLKTQDIDLDHADWTQTDTLQNLYSQLQFAITQQAQTSHHSSKTEEYAAPNPDPQPSTTSSHRVDKYLELQQQTIKQLESLNRFSQSISQEAHQQAIANLSPQERSYLKPYLDKLYGERNIQRLLQAGMNRHGLDPQTLAQFITRELEQATTSHQLRLAQHLINHVKPNSTSNTIQEAINQTLKTTNPDEIKRLSDALAPSPDMPGKSNLHTNVARVYHPYKLANSYLQAAVSASNQDDAINYLQKAKAAIPTFSNRPNSIQQEVEAAIAAFSNRNPQQAAQHANSAANISYAHQDDSLLQITLQETLSRHGLDPSITDAVEERLISRALGFDSPENPQTTLQSSLKDLKIDPTSANKLLTDTRLTEAVQIFSQQLHQSPLETIIKPGEINALAANLSPTEIGELNIFLTQHNVGVGGLTPSGTLSQTFRLITESLSQEESLQLAKLIRSDDLFSQLAPELPRFVEFLNQNSINLPNITPDMLQNPKLLHQMFTQFSSTYGQHPLLSFAQTTLRLGTPGQPGFFTQMIQLPANLFSGIRQLFSGGISNTLSNLSSLLKSTLGPAMKGLGSSLGKLGQLGLGGLRSLLSSLGGAAAGAGSTAAAGAAGAGASLTAISAPAWLPAAAVAGSIGAIFFIVFMVIPPSSSQLISTGIGGGDTFSNQPYAPGMYTSIPMDGLCWPAMGMITQDPENPSHGTTNGGTAFDIGIPIGTPLQSPFAGTVTFAGQCQHGYGYCVYLEATATLLDNSTRKFTVLFAHMDTNGVFVTEGQSIEKEHIIGVSGNTGRSTGPHLHYEAQGIHIREIIPTPDIQEGDAITTENRCSN